MMKTQSNVAYILRLALTLLVITAVVAVALAGVNSITAPKIEQLNAEKTQQAIETVLPGGFDTQITDYTDDTGLVTNVYSGANGYAFEVTPAGFDNTITMMVGVDHDGKVLGISIVSHTETSGLGAVAAASTSAGESFRGQFVGMSGSVSVTKDGGEVDSLTGATITSRAVCTGVNAALACAANLG
ncbi:MAG TPA: RnfABCDGE type electron transport complex subunit G [Candidatus Faecousia intestinavium]|nr:RnfABCDGE type electron transport complex subunit G [Candidatus Faecousia intestinavium]